MLRLLKRKFAEKKPNNIIKYIEKSICIFKYHYCGLYKARPQRAYTEHKSRAQSCILALLPALTVAITHLLMIIRKVSETDGNNGELAY